MTNEQRKCVPNKTSTLLNILAARKRKRKLNMIENGFVFRICSSTSSFNVFPLVLYP